MVDKAGGGSPISVISQATLTPLVDMGDSGGDDGGVIVSGIGNEPFDTDGDLVRFELDSQETCD